MVLAEEENVAVGGTKPLLRPGVPVQRGIGQKPEDDPKARKLKAQGAANVARLAKFLKANAPPESPAEAYLKSKRPPLKDGARLLEILAFVGAWLYACTFFSVFFWSLSCTS